MILRRAIPPNLTRSICCTRLCSASSSRFHHAVPALAPRKNPRISSFYTPPLKPSQARTYASSTSADALMESLNDLYATARDEFEIAAEETEKKSVYGPDDREAAAEALQALKNAYDKALREGSPEVAKEVQSRVGQRIRELENAVKAMEEMAMED